MELLVMQFSIKMVIYQQNLLCIGIPLKRYGDIDSAKAVQIASLASDFMTTTKKVLTKELRLTDVF